MNYCVAGVLIEALTGGSYVSAAYEQVLTPLGLSGLRLANTFDPGPQEVLHATTEGRNYMETLGAAGSWIATPSDLVTILDSLDHSTPGFKPLEPETVLLMETPTGAQYGQRGYGLGVISYGDGRYGHTGTIENTHAMVLDRGDGVTWADHCRWALPGRHASLGVDYQPSVRGRRLHFRLTAPRSGQQAVGNQKMTPAARSSAASRPNSEAISSEC